VAAKQQDWPASGKTAGLMPPVIYRALRSRGCATLQASRGGTDRAAKEILRIVPTRRRRPSECIPAESTGKQMAIIQVSDEDIATLQSAVESLRSSVTPDARMVHALDRIAKRADVARERQNKTK